MVHMKNGEIVRKGRKENIPKEHVKKKPVYQHKLPKHKFHENFRHLLSRRGQTVYQYRWEQGIPHNTAYAMARGDNDPSLSRAWQVANSFGVSLDEMLCEDMKVTEETRGQKIDRLLKQLGKKLKETPDEDWAKDVMPMLLELIQEKNKK